MNLELIVSLLSSTIILFLCIVIPFLIGGLLISTLWKMIDEPIDILVDRKTETKEERTELKTAYEKATEPYFVQRIYDHPDPYQDGRNYYKELSGEALEARKNEVEKTKSAFEKQYPDFLSELSKLRKSQKTPRFFLSVLSWLISVCLVFSATALFYITTGYFGVNINFKSSKAVKLEQQSQDQITKTLVGDLTLIAEELDNPRSLTLEQIEEITDKLPPAVSKLQSNLKKTNSQMRELQKTLKLEQAELNVQKEKFDIVRALSTEEFEAVKTVLFEETEKSTRRYYLIGLFSSIPVFWFSDLLKALFLKWLGQLKLVAKKNKEKA